MGKAAVLIVWIFAIVGLGTAGVWKFGEGGGWLVFLSFVMAMSTNTRGGS